MSIEATRRPFPWFKKYSEKVVLGKEYSLLKPPGVMKVVRILTTNKLSVYDDGKKNFTIEFLEEKRINDRNLTVLMNGKPVRLKWKKDPTENKR